MTAPAEMPPGDLSASQKFVTPETGKPSLPIMDRWPLSGAIMMDPRRRINFSDGKGIEIRPSPDNKGARIFSPFEATLGIEESDSTQPVDQVSILLFPKKYPHYALRLQFIPEAIGHEEGLHTDIPVYLKSIPSGSDIARMRGSPGNILLIQLGRQPDDPTIPFKDWEKIDSWILETLFPRQPARPTPLS